MQTYSYTILRPGGNDTALVNGIIRDPRVRKLVNDAIMKRNPTIEQVGFVNLRRTIPELLMAGGEFCGNATRCTAWLALSGKPGTINIRSSGANNTLLAGVTSNRGAFAQMPIYKDVGKVSVDKNNPENFIVEMQGIIYYVEFTNTNLKDIQPSSIRRAAKKRLTRIGSTRSPATGVIFTNKIKNNWAIYPVVYVRNINSFFFESACGSGTTALGLILSMKLRAPLQDISVLQPSGKIIKVSVGFSNDSFTYAQISGPIEVLSDNNQITLPI